MRPSAYLRKQAQKEQGKKRVQQQFNLPTKPMVTGKQTPRKPSKKELDLNQYKYKCNFNSDSGSDHIDELAIFFSWVFSGKNGESHMMLSLINDYSGSDWFLLNALKDSYNNLVDTQFCGLGSNEGGIKYAGYERGSPFSIFREPGCDDNQPIANPENVLGVLSGDRALLGNKNITDCIQKLLITPYNNEQIESEEGRAELAALVLGVATLILCLGGSAALVAFLVYRCVKNVRDRIDQRKNEKPLLPLVNTDVNSYGTVALAPDPKEVEGLQFQL
jgi:hypothetical protein